MKLKAFDFARDHEAWDEFVLSHPDGTFFHLAKWHQVLNQSYRGFVPQYQMITEGSQIVAVLPACRLTRPFVGTALISNPFAVSAGPLFNPRSDYAQLTELLTAGVIDVDYIEWRDVNTPLPDHWQTHQYFVNFAKALGPDHEENFLSIPNRQRAVIRKAEEKNLRLEFHSDLERFLKVYALSLRNLGTPIYPKRYFAALIKDFGENLIIASAVANKEDVTTVLCFKHANRLMPYYGGGTPGARETHAYPWMYWQLMKYGVEHDLPVFDFGRSPDGSGPYAFKKNLGFSPRALNYAYLPIKGEVPDLTGTSPMAKTLIQTWQKLPVSLTRLIGPVGAVYAV